MMVLDDDEDNDDMQTVMRTIIIASPASPAMSTVTIETYVAGEDIFTSSELSSWNPLHPQLPG